MKIYFVLGFLFLITPLLAADRITGRSFATRSEVMAQNGMSTTSRSIPK